MHSLTFSISRAVEEDIFNHMAELCVLENLSIISIALADFFGHLLFQLLEVRGDQFTSLSLNSIDEMNLNAVILIGDTCPNLTQLALMRCHFQMQINDPSTVDKLVKDRQQNSSHGMSILRYICIYIYIYIYNITLEIPLETC